MDSLAKDLTREIQLGYISLNVSKKELVSPSLVGKMQIHTSCLRLATEAHPAALSPTIRRRLRFKHRNVPETTET